MLEIKKGVKGRAKGMVKGGMEGPRWEKGEGWDKGEGPSGEG